MKNLLQKAWLSRGWLPWLLLPLAWVHGLAVNARRQLYRVGLFKSERFPVAVVVVGNVVAGGAGKTPLVIALATHLQARGHHVGVVSRGHGRSSGDTLEVGTDTPVEMSGDEPALIKRAIAAPVFVASKRADAVRALLAVYPHTAVVLCDDGLQHYALQRDIEIAAFDDRGIGNGWLLPAGPLREALPASVPARSLVLYNAHAASTRLPGNLAARSLAGAVELAAWRAGQAASIATLESLRGKPLAAVAGVARPNRFFEMLREQGLQISALPLPDHFDFATLPWPADTPDVVLTEKDAVKLDPERAGATRVWVVALDFALPAAFEESLLALLPAAPKPAPGIAHGNQTA